MALGGLLPSVARGVAVRGWPSPFSVSHGTLSDHPPLYDHFPAERRKVPYEQLWKEGKKTILKSAEVVERFGTTLDPEAPKIDLLLVVRFKPDEPTAIVCLETKAELVDHLRTVYLGSRDPIYHNWHRYVVCSEDQIDANIDAMAELLLASADVRVMTWAPSAESLMKRVPALARQHKDLTCILDL